MTQGIPTILLGSKSPVQQINTHLLREILVLYSFACIRLPRALLCTDSPYNVGRIVTHTSSNFVGWSDELYCGIGYPTLTVKSELINIFRVLGVLLNSFDLAEDMEGSRYLSVND